ncbi:MAG: ACT domain-containing protein [Candidatus Nitrosopelagicus sp.]|nr:ACT domain-containing protein [Candidatus Nitrosopelagicus sp.]MBT7253268.1 ACT domain-containing protein [Candidatus Nitrosopelagicus sp.]
MRTSGVSMPEVVREIITRNRSIYDCMKMDVINFTALAVKIQADVEKTMGGPIHLNTIVVAIKRYADSFETTNEMIDEPVLKDARLTLTDGIMGIQWNMVDAGDEMTKMLNEFHKEFTDSEFFRFGDSFRILAEDSDKVRRMFQSLPKENQYNSGLAKIKVAVPAGHSRSDVMQFVTEILHYNGIEMADALFTPDGLVIVLQEADAPRAYEKLRAQISR